MMQKEFVALLKEKLFAAVDQKQVRSKAEFNRGNLTRLTDLLFQENSKAATDLDALKVLWEEIFASDSEGEAK